MRAMLLHGPAEIGEQPPRLEDVKPPSPAAGQVRLAGSVCAVCRTDLHIVEGDLPMRKTPVIPGHQVVGTIDQLGQSVSDWAVGDRMGVAWLQDVDGTCRFCRRGGENLCPDSTDLPDANRALADMKHSRIDGSAVLRIG